MSLIRLLFYYRCVVLKLREGCSTILPLYRKSFFLRKFVLGFANDIQLIKITSQIICFFYRRVRHFRIFEKNGITEFLNILLIVFVFLNMSSTFEFTIIVNS